MKSNTLRIILAASLAPSSVFPAAGFLAARRVGVGASTRTRITIAAVERAEALALTGRFLPVDHPPP